VVYKTGVFYGWKNPRLLYPGIKGEGSLTRLPDLSFFNTRYWNAWPFEC
jgi:hypothetical protein